MAPAPPRTDIPTLGVLPLELTTARLTLRPVEAGDAEAIYAIARIPEFPAMMSWEAHASIDVTKTWLAAMMQSVVDGRGVVWAMIRDGELVGNISLLGITWQAMAWRRDRAEIGYWTAPAHQGQGYASEALAAVMRFGFDELGLHKLTIGCLAENAASKRVIEKAGFRFLVQIDEDVWRHDRWWSHLHYELTIGEWTNVSSTRRFTRP
ncbi:MAG: GNAT family N-acetyltransferase [Kofleriaceae bacterium]|nr:GNAT family N-acetyltransferase [Kofleriaceae bacterium]